LNYDVWMHTPSCCREKFRPRFLALWITLCCSLLLAPAPSGAQSSRWEKLAHYYNSLDSWKARAEAVRNGILTGAELSPLPERTPLNAVFVNRRVRDGYAVEDVAFEAKPGFYVFGNLYRPLSASKEKPAAAVLVAHGHFKEAGWYARTRPENQMLCATLAQMGAVVFTYDMVGWGDSTQLPHNDRKVLQLQLWDSISAVDFLVSLPEVDAKRIGVTGASGGATQIIYLAAVDPRVAASMPVVMVSSRYTGHERCEDGMKVHDVAGEPKTNNAEIAAVIAPRPLMLISDGVDWTKHFPTEDFPYVERIYKLYGAGDKVHNQHFAGERHDYGPSKRKIAYEFFSKALGLSAPPEKETAPVETQADQSVRNWTKLPTTYAAGQPGTKAR